jgi:tetratricopeptide (TPR) repeat protein
MSPEELEWANAVVYDPPSAPEPLLRLVARMDREGTLQERHSARSHLLLTYANLGKREEALKTLDEIQCLESENVEEGLPSPFVAANLLTLMGEFARAKVYIERALENGSKYLGDDNPPQLEAWFKGLLLWAQTELGNSEEDIESTLARLESLLSISFAHVEILPTLEKLLDRPALSDGVQLLLERMWGELAYQYRFMGSGSKQDLRRIEAMLQRLGISPKNDL